MEKNSSDTRYLKNRVEIDRGIVYLPQSDFQFSDESFGFFFDFEDLAKFEHHKNSDFLHGLLYG